MNAALLSQVYEAMTQFDIERAITLVAGMKRQILPKC